MVCFPSKMLRYTGPIGENPVAIPYGTTAASDVNTLTVAGKKKELLGLK